MTAPTTNRVVVTGIGVVSSLGTRLSKIFESVLLGETGITALKGPKWSALPCRVAGVITPEVLCLEDEFNSRDVREKSKSTLFALAAARRAIKDSRLELNSPSKYHSYGVSVGTGMSDMQEIYETGKKLEEKGLRSISPYFIPRNLTNMAAGHISMSTGFTGPNLAVSTACTTGLHAVGDGYRLIERGLADVMLCGGTETPVYPLGIAGFSRMKALCVDSNDNPSSASRPFDKSRSGFVMSEGAAVLILESRQHAVSRGARIYAELLGYGLSGDAHHISAPADDGDGAYRCMKLAVDDAGLSPRDVTYINAHATSTPLGDAAEAAAIHRLFEENDEPVNVSSTKGVFGHLLGAAGSLEAAMTVFSCYHGYLPPNINLDSPDVKGNIKLVKDLKAVWKDERRVALTNSFGFGGTNASLCISSDTK